jgi:hypothetical protein
LHAYLNQEYDILFHPKSRPGEPMSASDAERTGLVAKVLPDDQVLDAAIKTAEKIASYSSPVVMLAKEAVQAGMCTPPRSLISRHTLLTITYFPQHTTCRSVRVSGNTKALLRSAKCFFSFVVLLSGLKSDCIIQASVSPTRRRGWKHL